MCCSFLVVRDLTRCIFLIACVCAVPLSTESVIGCRAVQEQGWWHSHPGRGGRALWWHGQPTCLRLLHVQGPCLDVLEICPDVLEPHGGCATIAVSKLELLQDDDTEAQPTTPTLTSGAAPSGFEGPFTPPADNPSD